MGQVYQNGVWNKRMGHINLVNLVQFSKRQAVRDMPTIVKPSRSISREWKHGRKARNSLKTKEHSTSKPWILFIFIFLAPQGPKTYTVSITLCYFLMISVEWHWSLSWRKSHKHLENLMCLRSWLKMKVILIRCLWSYNGGKLTSNEFGIFCEEHGIKRQFLADRKPQQNGVAKRKNRIVQDMTRTMLKGFELSDIIWKEVVYTLVHILNRGLPRTNSDKKPYEV